MRATLVASSPVRNRRRRRRATWPCFPSTSPPPALRCRRVCSACRMVGLGRSARTGVTAREPASSAINVLWLDARSCSWPAPHHRTVSTGRRTGQPGIPASTRCARPRFPTTATAAAGPGRRRPRVARRRQRTCAVLHLAQRLQRDQSLGQHRQALGPSAPDQRSCSTAGRPAPSLAVSCAGSPCSSPVSGLRDVPTAARQPWVVRRFVESQRDAGARRAARRTSPGRAAELTSCPSSP